VNQKNLLGLMGVTAVVMLNGGCAAEVSSEDTLGESLRRRTDDGDYPIVEDPPDRPEPEPVIEAAPFADLRPTGGMTFTKTDPIIAHVQVEVVNYGTGAAVGHGTMRVGGEEVIGTLYVDGAPSSVHTLEPLAKGYIEGRFWHPNRLDNCLKYRAVIDVYHQMQPGATRFTNDSAVVKTPCPLTWTSPMNEATLFGRYPDTVIGGDAPPCSDWMCDAAITESMSDGWEPAVEPVHEKIRDKTLQQIVSSFTTGRVQGDLCSSCHFDSSEDDRERISFIRYVPMVAWNASRLIDKDEWIVDVSKEPEYPDTSDCLTCGAISSQPAKRWIGPDGWASAFITVLDPYAPAEAKLYKPDYLRQAFEKWIADGYQ
jgi:hypothetical protein